MKIKMTRTLFHGHETLMEGQVMDVSDGDWWVQRGFAVPVEPYDKPYETKPHPAVPTLAGGEGKPASASLPVRRSRRRKSTQSEGSE